MPKLFISDNDPLFRAQKSLRDRPSFFENDIVRGATFYLSRDKNLGGDSLTILGDEGLTMCMLADMTGHGQDGRENIKPFIAQLDQIAEFAFSIKDTELTNHLEYLDSQLKLERSLCLSIFRITSNKTIYYLNLGENILLVKQGKVLFDKTESPGNKLGWLSRLYNLDHNQIKSLLTLRKDQLVQSDKVLMFTDGVAEYLVKRRLADSNALANIKDIFVSSDGLEESIKKINSTAYEHLRKAKRRINDDYTLIALEVK